MGLANMSGDVETVFSSENERVYRAFFDHIQHENRLIIGRMTIMLQFEALLLIAYAAVFNGVIGSDRAALNSGLLAPLFQTLICMAGCYVSVTAASSIGAAWRAMEGYAKQFSLKCLDVPSLGGWPALRGAGEGSLSELGALLARAAPWVFLALWLLALALSWGGAVYMGLL